MRSPLTSGANDRPKQTIQAAELFHDNARSIAAACTYASNEETVVAVVTQEMVLGGVWTIPTRDLAAHVTRVENGGWSLVCSSGTTVDEIEDRSLKLARLAFARWEAMRRWASRQG